jgi:hypothetical protein
MLARIALARADRGGAEDAAEAGLRVLGECELPLVRWRLLSALARAGEARHSRARFDQARELVERYAHSIPDDSQRALFTGSRAVFGASRAGAG